MDSLINIFYKIYSKIMLLFGLRKYILFESAPDFSDNTLPVFNELVRRGCNKKYKFIWILNENEGASAIPFKSIKNVRVVNRASYKFKYYYMFTAKILVCCNNFLPKKNSKQKVVFLGHGCTVKDVRGKYEVPESYADDKGITLSPFTAVYDSKTLNASSNFMLPLGYPRNDILFEEKINLEKLFGIKADKYVYWLPTFRRHKNTGRCISSISIPIIHKEEFALRINAYAESKNIVLVVKPHPAQDLSDIKKLCLSNLVFIDNQFLEENGVNNYSLLGSCDALLTDYSSVMYDYLLVDKPIGLCWEDFEEYKAREGIIFNDEELKKVTDGCSIIYTCDDLEVFIDELASQQDRLKERRETVRSFIHKYIDGNSTARVTDYIMRLI